MLAETAPLDPQDGDILPPGALCKLLRQLHCLCGGRDKVSEGIHQIPGQPAEEVQSDDETNTEVSQGGVTNALVYIRSITFHLTRAGIVKVFTRLKVKRGSTFI